MTTPRIEHVWVTRCGQGAHAQELSRELTRGAWLADARMLKTDGGSWVARATILGQDVIVKCRPQNTLGRRIKSMLGMDQFDRHWRAADMLKEANIRTGEPVLLARAIVDGSPAVVLVLKYVEGMTVLDAMRLSRARKLDPSIEREIASELGVLVHRLEAASLFNRDLKPSNVIIVAGPAVGKGKSTQLAIIDLAGVRSAREGRNRMFASLIIEPTGCGVPPRVRLQIVAANAWLNAERKRRRQPPANAHDRRTALDHLRRGVGGIVQSHGDPTPRVMPTANG